MLNGLGVQFSPDYTCFNAAGETIESGRLAGELSRSAAEAKITTMRIEFAIDEAWPHPGHTTIAGRVHEADIALGDMFTILVRAARLGEAASGTSESTVAHPVMLRVDGIEAYRHSLELLSSGMTGLLKLTGLGRDLLRMVDASEGYGSWLLIGDKHAQPKSCT